MKFTKYLLSRTGLFPKFEPDVSDVWVAATSIRNIEHLHNPRGVWHWYVFPYNWKTKNVKKLIQLFKANGVLLRPHYSRYFQEWVLCTVNRNHQFMNEVQKVYKDESYFEDIIKNRKNEVTEREQKFVKLQKLLGHSR